MLQEMPKQTAIAWVAIMITAVDPSSQNSFPLLQLEIKNGAFFDNLITWHKLNL